MVILAYQKCVFMTHWVISFYDKIGHLCGPTSVRILPMYQADSKTAHKVLEQRLCLAVKWLHYITAECIFEHLIEVDVHS